MTYMIVTLPAWIAQMLESSNMDTCMQLDAAAQRESVERQSDTLPSPLDLSIHCLAPYTLDTF